MLRPRLIFTLMAAAFLATGLGLAQDREKVKYLTPSLHGSSGLFNLYVADTFRQGEFSIGLHATKFNREPGGLDFTIFPVSFTVGLHDRIELFGSYEVHKRAHASDLMVNKIQPGGLIVPSVLASGIGAAYNDAPFMDVGFGDGAGDLWAGIKFNLFSERRGDPLGVAIQPIARFHLTDDRRHLARGLTSGATDAGFDFILSKDLPGGGYFTGQAGALFAQDKFSVGRQNSFRYGVGVGAPMGTLRANFIGELVGNTFFGGDASETIMNPVSPLDVYLGFRVFPARSVALSGAYNLNLKTLDEAVFQIPSTDRHGFFAQLVFQRKVNRPPTIICDVERTTIEEGQSVTIRATVTDPDDDFLTVTWRSNGGRITQQNASAVFDSTGVTPGRFTIIGEVTDTEHIATCSVDITVQRRQLPPDVTCQPSAVTVTQGDSTTLRAVAKDAYGDPLKYVWTVDGQTVAQDQAEFEFGTVGRDPGTYTVRVNVTNVDGLSGSCEIKVTVDARPVRDPVVKLTLDKTEVYAGEIVTATADASHPDGEALTYAWTVDGQPRPETTAQIRINTSGMAGGPHTVTVTVTAERGGRASDTQSFTVIERTVIQMDGLEPDNVGKAVLDELALKLQQDPSLRARITGHTDSTGTPEINLRVGQQRADATKVYLVQQHNIDPDRIESLSRGQEDPIADNETAEGRRQNRRVEVELFVP